MFNRKIACFAQQPEMFGKISLGKYSISLFNDVYILFNALPTIRTSNSTIYLFYNHNQIVNAIKVVDAIQRLANNQFEMYAEMKEIVHVRKSCRKQEKSNYTQHSHYLDISAPATQYRLVKFDCFQSNGLFHRMQLTLHLLKCDISHSLR